MKKGIITVLVLVVLITTAILPAAAVVPEYTYECARLVYPVTFDGVVSADEWNDAIPVVVNPDSEILKKYGEIQGSNPMTTSDDISVTYRMKWDDEYFYLLEERYDKVYVINSDDAMTPWMDDGTLFFIAHGENPSMNAAFHPWWLTIGKEGKPQFNLRTYADNAQIYEEDPNQYKNWKYGSGKNGNVYTLELAIPWSDMWAADHTFPVQVGELFRWTPVIANFTDEDVVVGGDGWCQLVLYNSMGTVNTAENVDPYGFEWGNTGELPINWGGMKLVGPIVTIAPEPVPDDTNVDVADTPAPAPQSPTDSAAKTGDANTIFICMLISAICGCIFVGAKKFVKSA